jgi:hypothetical protein
MEDKTKKEKGFVVSIIAFFVMLIMTVIVISMGTIVFSRKDITSNAVKSTQSYYAAEAGVEDALEHLVFDYNRQYEPYALDIGGVAADVIIAEPIGGSRTVESQGSSNNVIKKIKAVYVFNNSGAGLHYGIQAGGGFYLGNGSTIVGNVMAGGNITGTGTVTNTVVNTANTTISGQSSGSRITVGGSVYTYNCLNANVSQNLTYAGPASGNLNCGVSGSTNQGTQIATPSLPISQNQIDAWKSEASVGEPHLGDYTVGNNTTQNIGPIKIIGNLSIGNGATLNMDGTIYVTGTIYIDNNATIKLADSKGPSSDVFLSDGPIIMRNGATLAGSGHEGSYIMALSTNSSPQAIQAQNGINGVVLYASNGGIELNNSSGGSNNVTINVRQITAKQIISLGNNITLHYDVGIPSAYFSWGPNGRGEITSWTEE